jgi:periplasmic protein TonB
MQTLTWPMSSAKDARPSLERSVGIVLAVLLHAALIFSLLQQKSTVQPEPIQPPAPMMVSLIAPAQPSPEPPKPTAQPQPEPVKPKPVKLTPAKPAPVKPKTQVQRTPKPAKSSPVIAAKSDAPSSQTVSAPEHSVKPAAPPPTQAEAAPAPAPAPVTPPRFNADYLDNPAPDYPPQSRSEGEEGKVLLRVLVSVHGHAEQVEIRRSSGFHRLDEAARSTVRHWRFVPAHQGDEKISAWVLVPIAFSIEG